MAKQKSPNTEKPKEICEGETQTKYKSKHNKKPTNCIDKRRGFSNCGICGSENTVSVILMMCNKIDKEEEFCSNDWWMGGEIADFCKCCNECEPGKSWKHISYKILRKCEDCGAVEAQTCPNCNKRSCWTSHNNKKYIKFCKACGYRNDYKTD